MASWDPANPFVYDAVGFAVGLKCVPPHHADLIEAGWKGGQNLFPLTVERPEHFTAGVLVYTRQTHRGAETATYVLSDESPYVYQTTCS